MLSLRNALEQLSRVDPFFNKLYILSSLKEHETQIFGEHIAKHCTFADYVEGRLTVVCDDFIWANEIRMLKRKLRKRILEMCKIEVRDILTKVELR
uniref:DUF721 domain-containing protein n=1 Tax=Fervidobacterium thailandense TaxID=1008305 RepID=A0A7C4RWV7_9BACT